MTYEDQGVAYDRFAAGHEVVGRKPRAYSVGPLTMAKVFKPAGLTNVHDLQAVLDAVEAALARS